MNEKDIKKELPINIVITSFNRLHFLKKCVEIINRVTRFPYRLIIVDNNSTDGTLQYLKEAKCNGLIWDFLFLERNDGQSVALNKAFNFIEEWETSKRRPSNDLIVTSNEDLFPPDLGETCWLTQIQHLFIKHEPEGLGAVCFRIERTARMEIDEKEDLIWTRKGIPSVFRTMRRSDLRKIGENPFGTLKHFDSNSMADKLQNILKKRYAFATHLYASHAGYGSEQLANKGYPDGFKEYFTYSGEHKDNIHIEKPYPDIDSRTYIPIKPNHRCDHLEQGAREKRWTETVDFNDEKKDKELLLKYVTGKTLDLSCGKNKITEDSIGIDNFHHDSVDIIGTNDDLWMIENNSVDTIVSVRGMEIITDIKTAIREWNRVLKSGGKIAMITSNANTDNDRIILAECYSHLYNRNIITKLFSRILRYKVLEIEEINNGDDILFVFEKI